MPLLRSRTPKFKPAGAASIERNVGSALEGMRTAGAHHYVIGEGGSQRRHSLLRERIPGYRIRAAAVIEVRGRRAAEHVGWLLAVQDFQI